MTTTMTLAANFGVNPFELFNQDTDEVILIINFYIALGDDEEALPTTVSPETQYKKQERIRVNDKTATNGWF